MRLDIVGLDAMRSVGSTEELWGRLNNDQYFEFRRYLRQAAGVDISTTGSDSPTEWAWARRLIDALERSVGVANLLLPRQPTAEDALALKSELEHGGGPAELEIEAKVLQRLLAHLLTLLVGLGDPDRLRVDDLICVRPGPIPEERFSRGEFDAFISYTHRSYADLARGLYRELEDRGFHCWLDTEELRLGRMARVDKAALKHQLRRALGASRHTVFFEMAQEATLDENVRGENEAFLWQSFEQRYARGLVYVRPSNHRVDTGGGEKLGEWRTLDDLADILGRRFETAAVSGPAPEPGPRRGDEPDLAEAREDLLRRAEEYFGRRVEMTPMAVLALLAPGKEEELCSGSDVLINLLRYDPLAARAFANAGVDLLKLFTVGVEINHRRWIAPRNWLLEDVCGFPDLGAPAAAELGRRSCLGTADVLHGLLRGAQRRHKQRELLDRTLRWMHPGDTPEARERLCDALIADLLRRADEGRIIFGRHGWLFVAGGGEWEAIPVMLCEREGSALVLQSQTPRLFPAEVWKALTEASFDSIEAVRGRYPEVALTLRPPLFASTAARCSRLEGDAATFLFSLAGARRLEEWPRGGAAPAGRLPRIPPFETPFGPVEWRPAILASEVIPAGSGDPDGPPSYLDLAFKTLHPLAVHASVRDLEFDDV